MKKQEEIRLKLIENARKEAEALNNQVVDEEALIDENGEYVIFSGDSSSKNESQLNNVNGPSSSKSDFRFEENFSKLNYVNKINILLKALMIERNKNDENKIRIAVMTREYTNKV